MVRSMKLEIGKTDLLFLVEKQLDNLFIYYPIEERNILKRCMDVALERCEFCFSKSRNKYYRKGNFVYFNPFHSGQYAIFLYYLSNTVYISEKNNKTLADRIYYLNKCLNGLDLFYEVSMPKVFFLDHPVGSVIGRATYGEYFSFSQGCTVGNNKGNYPTIGKKVKMFSGSKILGNCKIEDNVIISANCYVKDEKISSYSLVFGSTPNLIVKYRPEYFK